jgi:hypothetical protein
MSVIINDSYRENRRGLGHETAAGSPWDEAIAGRLHYHLYETPLLPAQPVSKLRQADVPK